MFSTATTLPGRSLDIPPPMPPAAPKPARHVQTPLRRDQRGAGRHLVAFCRDRAAIEGHASHLHVEDGIDAAAAQDSFATLEATVDRLTEQPAIDADALRLASAIAAGHVRITAADILRYTHCSEARASQLRRRVLSMADIDAPAVIDSETVDAVAPSRPRLLHSLPTRVA
ncbi:hypothetical protein Bcep1808_5532 [Burkholderia vietnamiensis G4]|uniref:Uncharacterized protein n=2 Tax=Burkholderiaceae TaxID=119060 RepID=A4JQC3_BURVG|nr:hypothetical protein Bcep1808_5532 [Burkholderia vietnamiensis G4]